MLNAGATIATYGPQGTGISFGNGQFPSRDNRYQVADNFSIVNGAHTAKVGVDFVRIASDVTFSPGSNGVYSFSSLVELPGSGAQLLQPVHRNGQGVERQSTS